MHVRRMFALLAVSMLVAGACGGSSDDEGGGDGDVAAVTDSGSGTDEGQSDADDEADEPAATDDGDHQMSGDSGSDWCDAIRFAEENPDDSPLSFDFFGLTPDQLEEQFEKNVEVMEDWADLAPGEIKGDVEVIAGAFRQFVDFGNEADWDVVAMSDNPEFASAFDDPEIERAGDRLDQYSQDVCGVSLDAGLGAGQSDAPPAVPEVSDEADLIDQLFQAMGLGAAGLIPDEIKGCMNDQLEASGAFPDGIATGFILDEQAFIALEDAATACDFEDF